jgi:hypothetical protein
MDFQKQTGEDSKVVRNKARLAAQGFSQVEGLDFGENFAHGAHLKVIRILLPFATSKGFKLYQMDVKSVFLNGGIHEEVYVRQPPGFKNPSILIDCTSFQKLCTGLSKLHRHGMIGLKLSCYIMVM